MVIKNRTLTKQGQQEFGHIFPEGVPCQDNGVPFVATLDGSEKDTELVFLVDWKSLSIDQQAACLRIMSEKFDVDTGIIRNRMEKDGHFPIQHHNLIESYDLRHLI